MIAHSESLVFDQLLKFPVDKITDNSVTDFDLFIRVSDHVVLYGAKGYHWFRDELEALLRNNLKNLYIRKQDMRLAAMYEKLAALPFIDKRLAPADRIVSLEQVGASFTKCLYEGEITEACVEKAKLITDSIIECISEDKTCIQQLSGLGDYDYYTFVHSMRVASYAVAVAVEMGIKDHHILRDLALGGIFHDIGKKEVEIDIIHKTGALTDQEWQKVRSHPEIGHNLIRNTILSHVPQEIILHHHEKLDGSGYPHGMDKTSLLPEVQIACLADVFDALTSTRSYQKKRSRFEALDFIRHNMLGTKISHDPFEALISCLVAE